MEISEEEVISLSAAVQKRYGVDFTTYEIKSLKRRIIRIINLYKLNSIFELWQKVLSEPAFVQEFKNEISVGLTSMFRDPQLWIFLEKYLKDFFKTNHKLSVWHAGCSTGEEVYTMGIVLDRADGLHRSKRLATDLSTRSLETAQNGEYRNAILEDYESNYKMYDKFGSINRYIASHMSDTFKMDKKLIQDVTFTDHNLVTDNYTGEYDIIFCRNVLIYFDIATKSKVLRQFHERLNDGGILIIGFFDSFIPFTKEKLYSYLDTDVRVLKKIEAEDLAAK